MKNLFWKAIASWGGIGFIPWAPGTMGSLAALLIYVLFLKEHWGLFGAVLAAVMLLGFYATQRLLQTSPVQDPGWVVVDEVLGQWITLIPLIVFQTTSPYQYLAALILFRFFDIKKPWGIGKIEQWPGAWGVLGDDLLAGFYGFVILFLWNSFF